MFVPDVEGVAWQRMVEHALAVQTGIWGGRSNLVVPLGWEIGQDELFWRLVDLVDPDIMAYHSPTFADAEDLAPERYAQNIGRIENQLGEQGFGEQVRVDQIRRIREDPFWPWGGLSEGLSAKVLDRIAPLHLNEELREVWVNGSSAASYPLTNVADLIGLPKSVVDITTTRGDIERLMLTHAVGRLHPFLKDALAAREMQINPVVLEQDYVLYRHLWPVGWGVANFTYPGALASSGLLRRLSFADPTRVAVVVGDTRRDFLLFHGLSCLRPHVYWLPERLIDDDDFVRELGDAVAASAQQVVGGHQVAITTADTDEAADIAAERFRELAWAPRPDVDRTPWSDLIPSSSFPELDAASERRVSLLWHEGETQELPTPVPVSVSAENPSDLRWMVTVEVEGWQPSRNRRIGVEIFRGAIVTEYESRAARLGPSYAGLSPVVQPFLGLEGSTARPRLHPTSVLDQLAKALKPVGWTASLSDKGAFSVHSARLFGGLEEFAHSLRSEGTRALLDAYLTPTTSNDPGIYLTDTRRRYLSLQEAKGVIGEQAATVLVDLYDRGVLLRGHVLKCAHCRGTSFHSLSREQEFTCARCGTGQRATRFSWLGTPEPEFRYALSEVVFQFLSHHGELPLFAVHEQFVVGRGKEGKPVDIAFEVELTSPDGQASEHDIVVTFGAELWIGEATLSTNLGGTRAEELARLHRLKSAADALSAYGVLFATTGQSFTAGTKQRVSTAFDDETWPVVVYRESFDSGADV